MYRTVNCELWDHSKCTSVNGGLAKPAPEHTYAVVERNLLCDCQLDLEHASVLRQLSSCSKGHSVQLHLKFHVNLAFWKLLKRTSPDVAAEIQPYSSNSNRSLILGYSKGIKGG